MTTASLLVLLVAVSPAIERAVDAVSVGVELVRATAARVLEGPALTEREQREAKALAEAPVAPKLARAPRVHTASRIAPPLAERTRTLPPPPVSEPGAPRGPPVGAA